MAILSIVTDVAGQSNVVPRLVKISTNDTLTTVTTAGYLNTAQFEGYTINPTDILLISYSGGIGFFTPTISGNNVTLSDMLSKGTGETISGGLTLTDGNIIFSSPSSLLFESFTDNITAHAGGGQASAVALVSEINRVTTVTTAGDSVALPAAAPGLSVVLMNHGANAMQVFGAGTDTINDVATATGVSQMAGSISIYACATSGKWYSEGVGRGYAGSLPITSYTNAITAHAGGGQASAVPLTTVLNRITTVATAADSVLLPASSPGVQITIANAAAANACNVFPQTGDQINVLGANAAFSLVANKTATFYCMNAGQWHSNLTA